MDSSVYLIGVGIRVVVVVAAVGNRAGLDMLVVGTLAGDIVDLVLGSNSEAVTDTCRFDCKLVVQLGTKKLIILRFI